MTNEKKTERTRKALDKLRAKRFSISQVAASLDPPRSRSLLSKAYHGVRWLSDDHIRQIEGFARGWR